MKITTIACTRGYQLPAKLGMSSARLRHIDAPVFTGRRGDAALVWGANPVVRSAVVDAQPSPVPLSRRRASYLT